VNERPTLEPKTNAPAPERPEDDLHRRENVRVSEQDRNVPDPGAQPAEPIGVLEILAASTWRKHRARSAG